MKVVFPERKNENFQELMYFCKGCKWFFYKTSITSQRYHPKYFAYDRSVWGGILSSTWSDIGMSSGDHLPSSIFLTTQHRYWWNGWSWTKGNLCSCSGTGFTELVFLVDAKCNADTTDLSSDHLDEHFKSFPRATL